MSWSSIKSLARDWLIALAVIFLIWVVYVRIMAPSPQASGPVPPFALETLDGQLVDQDTHDDVVVLNFWFTSCPPCRREIPEIAAWHDANPDVPLYGISVDRMEPARLKVLSRKLGINYPVLHDRSTRVAGAFGVSLFPTTVVLHKGEIVGVRQGEVDRRSLSAMVDAAH